MKKTILIIAILSLSFLVNCDNPKSKEMSAEKRLELAEKCSKAGREFIKGYFARNNQEGCLWDEPEYHYNSRLNTCLIHIRYLYMLPNSMLSLHYNQVIDIFANKPILYGYFQRDSEKNTETLLESATGDAPNYTSIEYFKQKNKLFSE